MQSTLQTPQTMTKSQFLGERHQQVPDKSTCPPPPSVNPSRPIVRQGRLTKRHPSPLVSSVSAEDVSAMPSWNIQKTSSSAPPSMRYGKLSRENLPHTSTSSSNNMRPKSSLRKRRRIPVDDAHSGSFFACFNYRRKQRSHASPLLILLLFRCLGKYEKSVQSSAETVSESAASQKTIQFPASATASMKVLRKLRPPGIHTLCSLMVDKVE